MLSFKAFLQEEVAPTKRKGMQHLQNMKPVDFIALMGELQKQFPSGIVKNINIELKVDGMGFRFGRDAKNRSFFESSYSGPVYDPGRFVAYAKERGDPGMIARAEKIEEIFAAVVNSDLMAAVPVDRKVVCEILYNPLGEITASGAIKFAQVEYDRNKLGRMMTVAPFAVLVASTGERAPDAEQILASLQELSSSDIKVISTRLQHTPIDISATIDAMKTLTPNAVRILQSRKKADSEAKVALIQTIQAVKDRLADIIVRHKGIRGKDIIGDQIEGLVLSFGDHQVKVTTPEQKQAVARRREQTK
jgi:hypothetical protein